MTITSIGSSFSYIRPDAVARETAAAAVSEERGGANPPGFGAPDAPQASGSANASVADELRAQLVRTQETATAAPTPGEASRAYGGR